MRSVLYLALLLPYAASAGTIAPTAEGWGWDDNNIVTLNPWADGTASYVTTCAFLANAVASSAFNDSSKWTFRFAFDTPNPVDTGNFTLNGPGTIQPFTYRPWVVEDKTYKLPNGADAVPRDAKGDVGGADFTLLYQPGKATDPSLNKMHFLQLVRTITTFGNADEQPVSTEARYFIDADTTSPFYDQSATAGFVTDGHGEGHR
jgi:hypothetical protein